ncbi:unnamed protein product [Anisakis simplex]|uniref:Uncharacterized protein n=1 Tax=Anisakis simplex TaxID=6269 RepID=A0A0M3JJF6_ANISI|nr:unnamed protein product [Anisakis simplex]
MTSDQAEIKLNAYTPAARGIAIRQPPILPFCAKLKGSRIAGTAQYRVRPIKFPVNQRRLRRENGGGAKPWRN